MPKLDAVVIDIPAALKRIGPTEVWQEIEAGAPEAFQPLLEMIAQGAPIGPTGKLASSQLGIRVNHRQQGLIQGVDVTVGDADPIAHLVAEGHQIIPRGPTRTGKLTRARRAEIRATVKSNRAAGSIGFVPGNPWVEMSVQQQRAAIIASIEAHLRRVFGQ